jgi:aquaporin Z
MEALMTKQEKAGIQDPGVTDSKPESVTLTLFFSEMIGTALLLLLGLSLVIFMYGVHSPIAELIPGLGTRRLISGFIFGSIGAFIALSRVGTESGAHINPIVTIAFRLMDKLDLKTTLVYIAGQLTGAVLGCLPLLIWGEMGRSIAFGATLPGSGYPITAVFLGEVFTTFAMVLLLGFFLAYRKIRPYTPALFPPLYSIMSWLEAAISGTSTNPARSFGPSLISGHWDGWWIYWIGPITGMFLAVTTLSFLAKKIETAKLYHFDSNQDRIFRRKPKPSPESKGWVAE